MSLHTKEEAALIAQVWVQLDLRVRCTPDIGSRKWDKITEHLSLREQQTLVPTSGSVWREVETAALPGLTELPLTLNTGWTGNQTAV